MILNKLRSFSAILSQFWYIFNVFIKSIHYLSQQVKLFYCFDLNLWN